MSLAAAARSAAAGLFAILLLCAPPARADDEVRSFALVIGNNAAPREKPDLPALRYADDDAARFASLIDRVTDDVVILSRLDTDTQRRFTGLAARTRPPSLLEVGLAVESLAKKLKAARADDVRTRVYIYFSGHGDYDSRGAPFLALEAGSLTQADLFETILPRLQADRVHLIVDACNAAAMVGTRGLFDEETEAETVPAREFEASLEGAKLDAFPHVGALLASTAGKAVHEWSRLESGVFTHEVLSGLQGAADINGDRIVEYSELLAFVSSANSMIVNEKARPSVVARPPVSDQRAPLIDLSETKDARWLVGRPGSLGRFFIELDSGLRYLDAHFTGDHQVAMLLPAGATAYVRTPSKEARIEGTAERVRLESLVFSDRRLAQRGAIADSFQRNLFARAYGRPYYSGYVDSQRLISVPLFELGTEARYNADAPFERAATTAWIIAGAAFIASAVTAGLAIDARNDFNATTFERPAEDAAQRYDNFRLAAVVTGAVAVAAGGFGVWMWLERGSEESLAGNPPGATTGIGLGVTVSW